MNTMNIGSEHLYAYLSYVDSVLSRTVMSRGVDTTVSHDKQPPIVLGDDLVARMQHNVRMVASYIDLRSRRPAVARGEFVACLLCVAELYSHGIFPNGLFRAWNYFLEPATVDCSIPPEHIWESVNGLEDTYYRRVRDGLVNDVHVWVEWELGIGPVYPFYDACGRISRYFSTLVAQWHARPLKVHRSRAAYMAAACGGIDSLVQYYANLPDVEFSDRP